jgi:hypothetical protein
VTAPDLSESRDLAAMWRERAEAAEALTQRLAAAVWAAIGHRDPPPLDKLPAEECMVVASEVRLRFDDLAMARDNHHARAERAEAALSSALAKGVEMRETIAGRTKRPTDAEIDAHCAAGGRWLMTAGHWNSWLFLSNHQQQAKNMRTFGLDPDNKDDVRTYIRENS